MSDEDIGVELMRLHHQLRAERDPRVKGALRQLIDRAQTVMPQGYARVGRDRHL